MELLDESFKQVITSAIADAYNQGISHSIDSVNIIRKEITERFSSKPEISAVLISLIDILEDSLKINMIKAEDLNATFEKVDFDDRGVGEWKEYVSKGNGS